jgi:hypothetical protein
MLLQHLDDLLFGKSALAHVRLPKERTLPKIGDIYGEQVTEFATIRERLIKIGARDRAHYAHSHTSPIELPRAGVIPNAALALMPCGHEPRGSDGP